MKGKKKWKQTLAYLICAAMLCGSLLLPGDMSRVSAAESSCRHHTHDEACGYDETGVCNYECQVCKVQEMIDALPAAEEITTENAEEISGQLEAIDTEKEKLSDEQMNQLDAEKYTAAAAALAVLDGQKNANEPDTADVNEEWGGDYDTATEFSIKNLEELQAFAALVNSGKDFSGKTVKLEASIDLSSIESWTPIGTKGCPFKGIFDGGSYTISNLTINNPELAYAGLFGDLNSPGVIKNVIIENASVTGLAQVGALAGAAYTGAVDNCVVKGNIFVTGNYKTGGLAGEGYAKITNCSVIGNSGSYVKGIYKQEDLEGDSTGGLVGYRGEGSGIVTENCHVSGVSVEGTRKVGGLLGTGFNNSVVKNCTVSNVSVASNATEEYANAKQTSMGVGGLIGIVPRNGTTAGTLANCSVENITLNCPEEIAPVVRMGYVTGGIDKAADFDAPTDSEMAVSNVSVSGTNSMPEGTKEFSGAGNENAIVGMESIFASGVGTEASPFVISSAEQLAAFRDSVNNGNTYAGQFVKLSGDIDLSGQGDWTPIGNSDRTSAVTADTRYFAGTFDGGGYTISNLKNSTWTGNGGDTAYGLFGLVSGATLKNINFENVAVDIANGDAVGALAGQSVGEIHIENVHVKSGSIKGNDGVAGIIGRSYSASGFITDCSNAASVSAEKKAGGVAGYPNGTAADAIIVEKCINTGSISGEYAGGIAYSLTNGIIRNCVNEGVIQSTTAAAGGIAAITNSGSVVNDCVNKGSVSADSGKAGGIIGNSSSGGAHVSRCTNTAAVTGASAAGIIGSTGSQGEYIDNCYNHGAVKATGADGIAAGIFAYKISSGEVKACVNDAGLTAESGTVYPIGSSVYWYGQAPGDNISSCYTIDTETEEISLVDSKGENPTVQNMTRVGLEKLLNEISDGDYWQAQNGTVQPKEVLEGEPDGYVAVVGEEKYDTLEEAIAKASAGATVTLIKDVKISDTITIDKSLTLDLDEHTITGTVDNYMFDCETADAQVVVKNGTVNSNTSGFYWAAGALTFENVEVTVEEGRALFMGDAVVTIDKDSVLSASSDGEESIYIHVSNASGSETPVLNVYGTVSAAAEGDEEDPYAAISSKAGNPTIHIYDGAVVSNKNDTGIYIQSKAALNISGGLIEGNTASVNIGSAEASVSVSGGTLDGKIKAVEGIKGFITGGTFTEDVSEYCADSYQAVATPNADGKYVVVSEEGAASADKVTEMIQALPDAGNVKASDAAAINAAKAAYDSLSDAEKALISDADKAKLDAAVKALEAINQGKDDGNNGSGGNGSANTNKGTNTSKNTKAVQTGDSANLVLWVILAVIAAGAAAGVVVKKRGRHK